MKAGSLLYGALLCPAGQKGGKNLEVILTKTPKNDTQCAYNARIRIHKYNMLLAQWKKALEMCVKSQDILSVLNCRCKNC